MIEDARLFWGRMLKQNTGAQLASLSCFLSLASTVGLPYLNSLDKLVGQRNPSCYQGNVCRLIKYSDWMIKIMCKIMLGQNDLQNTCKSSIKLFYNRF